MSNEIQKIELHISFSTILMILFALVSVKILEILSPLFLPLLIAILLAISLDRPMNWLVSQGIPRKYAVTLVTFGLAACVVLLALTVVPSVYNEAVQFMQNLPQFREDLLSHLGENNPLRSLVSRGLTREALMPKADQFKDIVGAGNVILGGFGDLFLTFILAVYLLADGPRMVQWLSAFFPSVTQQKIAQTNEEASKIVSAYIGGQVITSVLSFIFVLIALLYLKVPSAPLLAALAGILDILPVLGFVLAVIPAMLFASKVSSDMPWIVLGFYVFYHCIENYIIVPWVYGNRMRVSSFVVFFALIAAGFIGGIEAAVIILPIVASYPIIEKIWLKPYLRRETIAIHENELKKEKS